MTSLAAPVFAQGIGSQVRQVAPWPTRYLYEARPESDDRRALSLTFTPGYDDGKRRLLEAAVEVINRLLQLPARWDGGTAERVTELAAVTAVEWLEQIAPRDVAVPYVVPLHNGGIQLEWVTGGQSFEIEVSPDGDVGALGVDAAGNPIVEGEFPAPDGTTFLTDARKFLASMFASDRPIWR